MWITCICCWLDLGIVMTGQRRVDPCAVRYLIDRIKQAKVSGHKQEYQRQGRDVNNTRQMSGSQAEVGVTGRGRGHRHRFRVPRSGSPGSNTEIANSRMGNAQKCQPGQEQDFAVSARKCAAYMCVWMRCRCGETIRVNEWLVTAVWLVQWWMGMCVS